MLDSGHQNWAHADHYVKQWTAQKKAARDIDMSKISNMKDRSACIQVTVTYTQTNSWRFFKTGPAPVVHTDVAEIITCSLSVAEYFDAFIDKAPGLERAGHMKTKGDSAELLKEHVTCTVRETESSVKNNVEDDRNESAESLQDEKSKEF